MPRVADYRTIVDAPFSLQANQIKPFFFSMPSGFHSASRSILFFQFIKPEGATIDLRIHLNNPQQAIWRGIITGDTEFHSLHETINPNTLKQEGNDLSFFSEGSSDIDQTNPVRIGDVFILCQVDI